MRYLVSSRTICTHRDFVPVLKLNENCYSITVSEIRDPSKVGF